MNTARSMDALCAICQDVTPHDVVDAGSCRCTACGEVQQLMAPLA